MKQNLKSQRVLLRVDLNIPMINGTFISNHRLKAIQPTIDLILKKGGKVILLTHIGRPKQKESYLSTKKLIPLLESMGYEIDFEKNLEIAKKKSFENFNKILLIENLRFFSGEKNNDPIFAKKIASLGDYYINDAFGIIHRTDSSIIDVPKLFNKNNRSIGLLIKKELTILNKLIKKVEKPFILIIGGAKIKDKIPLIESFIGKANMIILCPAIVFSFLKSLSKPIGKSLVNNNLLSKCKNIIKLAKTKNTELLFPIDYQIANNSFDGPTSYINSTNIPNDSLGISIGEKTEKLFAEKISKAKTIFFNGAIGNFKKTETLNGMKTIFSAMTKSKAFTIIGGGNSIAALEKFNLKNQINFCSTGGGATLAYLSGKNLPAINIFIKNKKQ